jgi:acetylornithine deacetylase/succinyl-diaminopimelate desuccinylase-like protein
VDVDWEAAEAEALDHFRQLLRIDTTNPPGGEIAACRYLEGVFRREGFEPTIFEPAPGRGNLLLRLDGGDRANGLMVSAHLDVVPAEGAHWTHPPFGGEVHDGYIWGRGTVDMKHMAIYGLMAVLLIKRSGLKLKRDLLYAAIADEEAGMRFGSRYLVENHADLLEGRYCLTEVGGFTMHIGGQRIYPVQIAEKGVAWLKMTVRGTPGHGSMPHGDNAVVKLARAIDRLARKPLPRHPNVAVTGLIKGLAQAAGMPLSIPLRLLLVPGIGEWVLDIFPNREQAKIFSALLHDTACPTNLAAGSKENVIPSAASVVLDCRILPGSSLETLQREIRSSPKNV